IDDGGDERLLAGEILVERADADPRHLGDAVGAGSVETLPDQNASGRFDKRVNRRARSRLRRMLPGTRERPARHGLRSKMRVDTYERSLVLCPVTAETRRHRDSEPLRKTHSLQEVG